MPRNIPGQGPLTQPRPVKPVRGQEKAVQGAAAIGEVVRVAPPPGKPQPALQKIGYWGSIEEFNNRVAEAVRAHTAVKGFQPSPGLTLDLARSPVPVTQFEDMFKLGSSQLAANNHTLAADQQKNPYDYFHVRADGVIEQQTPLTKMLSGLPPLPPEHPAHRTLQQLQKQYPNVPQTSFILPIPHADDAYKALSYLDSHGGLQGALQKSGLTLEQFNEQVKRGTGAINPDLAAQAEMTMKLQKRQGATVSNPGGPLVGTALTLSQAKIELSKVMGTSLSAGGFFTQDDAKKLDLWMKSADYFRKVTKYQADQYGLTVQQFQTAWKRQQDGMRKHGFAAHFLGLLPLQTFAGGGALAHWLFMSGGDPISSAANFPVHSASLVLGGVGGTVEQLKADVGTAGQFVNSISPKTLGGKGKSYHESLVAAEEQLRKNPSWARVFFPDAPDNTATRILDAVGDIVLLRKANFTGERAGAGLVGEVAKTDRFAHGTHYSFIDAGDKSKLDSAASALGGGEGANKLVTFAHPLIKSGKMTVEQFRSHASEMYETGRTTIIYPARGGEPLVKEGYVRLYRGEGLRAPTGTPIERANAALNAGGGQGQWFSDSRQYAANYHKEGGSLQYVDVPKGDLEGYRFAKNEYIVPKGVASGSHHIAEASGKTGGTGAGDQAGNQAVGGKSVEIIGGIFGDLRTGKIPSPGHSGRAWLNSRRGMRSTLDSLDESLRRNPAVGGKVNAVIGTVRSAIAHTHPKGSIDLYDDNLSEGVYNFINKNKLGDRKLADKYASDIVRFQAKDNTVGLVNLNRRLNKLYHGKYSDTGTNPVYSDEEFNPLIGTEAPTRFMFPGGGDRPVQGSMLNKAFLNLDYYHRHVNDWFNKFARMRSRFILGSGLSLFWKHAIGGDPARVAVGGGLFAHGPEITQAAKDIDTLARSNVSVERALGVFLNRSRKSEALYMLGDGGTRAEPAFHTGDKFNSVAHMDGAGAKLRGLVLDDALAAYQRGTLLNLVRHDRLTRRMFHSAQKAEPELTMEEYANRIHGRYASVEDAAAAAGVDNVFDRAAQVVRENRGAGAAHALGEFIKDNKLDFGVDSARVDAARGLDKLTGAAVGKIMTPNKFWRERFAKNILHKTFAEMTAAGMGHEEAFAVSTDLAARTLKYHMLDFANRLQVEQDLRYVSWFFTKHRLYWKWVIGTFLRHPGYAAVVEDARKLLDQQGNINLPAMHIPLIGDVKLSIPAARMYWVPNQDYPATSPDVQFITNVIKNGGDFSGAWNQVQTSGVGNSFTRVDTAGRLLNKASRTHTYADAIRGLPPKVQHRLNRSFNEYQLNYFADHGHYNMDESQVVSHVLWHATGEEAWRSILPLPIVSNYNPNEQQKLLEQYMMLTDPKRRQDFLVAHEDLAAQFGIYKDPKQFLHNQQLFGKYLPSLDAYRAVRSHILEQAKGPAGWTAELQALKKQSGVAFQKTFANLLREDARSAGHRVSDTETPGVAGVPLGPWGKLVSTDPQIDPTHILNGLFPGGVKTKDWGKVYGRFQEYLKKELAGLSDPKVIATYADDPGEVKIRRGEILQQLQAFQGMPKDALGVTTLKYQEKYVNPYWAHIDKENKRINGVSGIGGLPADQHDAAYAALRVWRDEHDRPVTIDGVKFPSPIRVAWAGLEPAVKHQRLAYFAAKGWDHLSDYEKDLLGRKPDAKFSEGWAKLEEIYAEQADQLHLQGQNMPKGYKRTLAQYVDRYYVSGFIKDFNFAQKPLYQRLQLTTIIQHSPYKTQWNALLGQAAGYAKLLAGDTGYSHTSVRAVWKTYVNSPAFQQWLDRSPGFKKELADFGPDMVKGLISGPR